MPARGGAMVLRPGINFARSRERAPCLEKTPSVRRTQESGSREILLRNCRIRMPLRRPISEARNKFREEQGARALLGKDAFGTADAGVGFERNFAEKLQNTNALAAAEDVPDGVGGQSGDGHENERSPKTELTGTG